MDAHSGEPLTSVDDGNPRRTFLVMCACFGLNHAAVTVPVAYGSSVYGSQVGNASNAALYGVCMLSALFLGPLLTSSLGPKNALVFGMFAYVVYVLLFALGLNFVPDGSPIEPETFGTLCAVIGGVIGGIGAGSLWTAQGAFFGAICEQISDSTGIPLASLTAELSSTFAIVFLGQECFWKVLFTLITKYGKLSFMVAFLIYAGLAGIATVVMFLAKDARPKVSATSQPVCTKALAALNLWSDPKIWLVSGMNFTFGFCAAYLNGYVNSTYTTKALSADFLGFMGAIVALIATFSSKAYGVAAEKMGTKVPIVILGSSCFLGIALLSFITVPECEYTVVATNVTEEVTGPGCWSWGIMVFYVLQGLGRGVYESTNKAIFADFFPGDKSVGGFANCILQNTGSSTIGFVLGIAGVGKQDVWILIVGSLATVPMLVLATSLKNKGAGSMVAAES